MIMFKIINLGKTIFESKERNRALDFFNENKNRYEKKNIYYNLKVVDKNNKIIIEKVGK